MIPAVAVALPSTDGVVIYNVLPVFRMTSCFHTMGPVARIQHATLCLKEIHQVAVPVGRETTAAFG